MQNRSRMVQEFFAFKNFIDRANLKANAKTELEFLVRRALKKNKFELIAQVTPNANSNFYLMATVELGQKWKVNDLTDFPHIMDFCQDWLNENCPEDFLMNFTEEKGIQAGQELRRILVTIFIPK